VRCKALRRYAAKAMQHVLSPDVKPAATSLDAAHSAYDGVWILQKL
jgi:hypothetical protein